MERDGWDTLRIYDACNVACRSVIQDGWGYGPKPQEFWWYSEERCS